MANYFNTRDLVCVVFIEFAFSASQNSIYQLASLLRDLLIQHNLFLFECTCSYYHLLFRVKGWYILNYSAYVFYSSANKHAYVFRCIFFFFAYVFNLKCYIWIFKLI